MNKLTALLLAATVAFTSACSEKPEKERAYVAVIGPMTGPAAIYGEWIRKGIQSSVSEGASHVDFELLDSGGDPKTAVTLARKALDKKGVIAVWATTSGENMAVRDMVTGAGLSLITSSATSPEITDGRPGVYRTIVNSRQETKALVDFAVENLKPNTVSVLYINDAGGQASLRQFEGFFAEHGVQITFKDTFEKSPADSRLLAIKALADSPDLVVVTGYSAAMGEIIKGLRQISPNVRILCNQGLDTPENMALPASVLTNVYYSIAEISEGSLKSAFATKYAQAQGKQPGIYEITAYDTASLISSSAKSVGADREAFRKSLSNNKFSGLNGTYEFTQKGNVNKAVSIRWLDQGKNKLVLSKISTVE